MGWIQTRFRSKGIAQLSFVNCYAAGHTHVYLNKCLLKSAPPDKHDMIFKFSYRCGDLLEIKEEQNAVMKINFFTLSC